jgi:hypothetical protein
MNSRLSSLIRAARRRWRMRVALGELALGSAVALAAVLAATWMMDRFRFAPASVVLAQVAAWGLLVVLVWRALARALRRVGDSQIALYLEEHEPAFHGSLLAAVSHEGAPDPGLSRALLDRVVGQAVAAGEGASVWATLERRSTARAWAALAAVVAAVAALAVTRPAFLVRGAPFLLPLSAAERPYTIGLEPGDTTIPRGADLALSATLHGFTAEAVDLLSRRDGADWERQAMQRDDSSGTYGALLLALRGPLSVMVEAAGVRSREYRVRVADLPWVDSIWVTYHFPGYTGRRPRQSEGGDIAAVTGTTALISVKPTIPAGAGALLVGSDTLALRAGPGGRLAGSLPVRASGEYRVLLSGPDGSLANGSRAYAIEALEDLPPAVRMSRPGRDADATPIDEVFLEAQAEDDIGVRRLELVYRVNGGEERTVALYSGEAREELTAGHTLYLEEYALQPGDVVSYYARARDGRPGAAARVSDIYFLNIRPFDRSYREAEQSGMQGGEGRVDTGELSERQRQIVAAAFRVARDQASMSRDELRDNLATLALSQGRLREDVTTLVRRLRTRGVADQDSALGLVTELLDTSLTHMALAEREFGRRSVAEALTPAQRALALLQRAEAVFDREREVARGSPRGDGRAASAEELADLFELELDRMRNQYETVTRERRRQADADLDETMERLRELARRQQRENERRAAAPPGTQPGAAQRRLAADAESLARRLERLSREQESPEVGEAARRLREAAAQMRRSLGGDGTASAEAVDRLRQAQQELGRGRTSGLRRDVAEAGRRARQLADQQRGVGEAVLRLPEEDGPGRSGQIRRLAEAKDAMGADVRALESELERLAREAQREQQAALARGLREAARGAREGRLEDKIRYSRGVMQGRSPEVARSFEEQIATDLDSLAARIAAAAGAMGESREERIARALERTRDVAEALETLGERAARPADGAAPRAPGGEVPDGNRAGQAAAELRERARELARIRDALRREGVDTRELDALIGGMSRADNLGPAGTPRGIEELARVIVPALREFEFGLRRRLPGAGSAPHATAEASVPPEYRTLVAEYFRALAERRR